MRKKLIYGGLCLCSVLGLTTVASTTVVPSFFVSAAATVDDNGDNGDNSTGETKTYMSFTSITPEDGAVIENTDGLSTVKVKCSSECSPVRDLGAKVQLKYSDEVVEEVDPASSNIKIDSSDSYTYNITFATTWKAVGDYEVVLPEGLFKADMSEAISPATTIKYSVVKGIVSTLTPDDYYQEKLEVFKIKYEGAQDIEFTDYTAEGNAELKPIINYYASGKATLKSDFTLSKEGTNTVVLTANTPQETPQSSYGTTTFYTLEVPAGAWRIKVDDKYRDNAELVQKYQIVNMLRPDIEPATDKENMTATDLTTIVVKPSKEIALNSSTTTGTLYRKVSETTKAQIGTYNGVLDKENNIVTYTVKPTSTTDPTPSFDIAHLETGTYSFSLAASQYKTGTNKTPSYDWVWENVDGCNETWVKSHTVPTSAVDPRAGVNTVSFTYPNAIAAGSGEITITEEGVSEPVATLQVSSATISSTKASIFFDKINKAGSYTINLPAGAFVNTVTGNPSAAESFSFTVSDSEPYTVSPALFTNITEAPVVTVTYPDAKSIELPEEAAKITFNTGTSQTSVQANYTATVEGNTVTLTPNKAYSTAQAYEVAVVVPANAWTIVRQDGTKVGNLADKFYYNLGNTVSLPIVEPADLSKKLTPADLKKIVIKSNDKVEITGKGTTSTFAVLRALKADNSSSNTVITYNMEYDENEKSITFTPNGKNNVDSVASLNYAFRILSKALYVRDLTKQPADGETEVAPELNSSMWEYYFTVDGLKTAPAALLSPKFDKVQSLPTFVMGAESESAKASVFEGFLPATAKGNIAYTLDGAAKTGSFTLEGVANDNGEVQLAYKSANQTTINNYATPYEITLDVPARLYKIEDGDATYVNAAFTKKLTVVGEADNYDHVTTPEPGEMALAQNPEGLSKVTLDYGMEVAASETASCKVYRDGAEEAVATATVSAADGVVELTLADALKENGEYKFVVEAGSLLFGENKTESAAIEIAYTLVGPKPFAVDATPSGDTYVSSFSGVTINLPEDVKLASVKLNQDLAYKVKDIYGADPEKVVEGYQLVVTASTESSITLSLKTADRLQLENDELWPIETSGQYMLNIPEKAITVTDADGNEYENEAADILFRIVPAVSTSVVPERSSSVYSLSTIEVIFSGYRAQLGDTFSATLAAKGGQEYPLSASVDESGKLLLSTAETITTPDNYTFTLPLGALTLVNTTTGATQPNPAVTASWELVEVPEAALVSVWPTDNSEVQSFGNVNLTYTVAPALNKECTEEVKFYLDGEVIEHYGVDSSRIQFAIEGDSSNKISYTLSKSYTTAGVYTVSVPAGFLLLGPNKVESEAVALTYTIIAPDKYTVSPRAGVVDSLDKIVVTYTDASSIAKNEEATSAISFSGASVAEEVIEGNVLTITLSATVDAEGTYTLNIPAGYLNVTVDGKTAPNQAVSVEYVIPQIARPTIDPAEGEITSLGDFSITLKGEETLSWVAIYPAGRATLWLLDEYGQRVESVGYWFPVRGTSFAGTQTITYNYYDYVNGDAEYTLTEGCNYALVISDRTFAVQRQGDADSEDGLQTVYSPEYEYLFSCVKTDDPNSVASVFGADAGSFTVYTINGICVLRNADKESLNTLENGFYVINGKKVLIRK